MTAYAYLRKSSVHDPKREVSYEVQVRAVHELAARHDDNDGKLVVLSDWDKSGRLGADKRPGYRALLEVIESGQATAIYSYSLSRLARSVQELSRLVADCTKRGIPVRLSVDALDTSTASGKLLAHVLMSVAQFESDIASERVRGANAAKLADGKDIGTARPYGQVRTTVNGEVRGQGEDGGAVLAAFREAGSFSGAAKLLNERGVKPRNSSRGWWPSSVAVVVQRLDPTVKPKATGVRSGPRAYTLSRLLTCPTCGTLLTGARDRDGRRVRYSCRLGTALPHPRISVTESHILGAIRTEAAHLRAPSEVQTASADTTKRAHLEAQKPRVWDMFQSGNIDRGERERRLAVVDKALRKLDDRQVVQAVPTINWDWPVGQLNTVLQALFTEVKLDPATFQPVAFTWAVPEWRRP